MLKPFSCVLTISIWNKASYVDHQVGSTGINSEHTIRIVMGQDSDTSCSVGFRGLGRGIGEGGWGGGIGEGGWGGGIGEGGWRGGSLETQRVKAI